MRIFVLFMFLAQVLAAFAESPSFVNYKLYGRVRADLFYNSRANEESVDGLFYMYPKDKVLDADGNDLNGEAQGSFYMIYTRLGVDISLSQPLMGAKTSAVIEADFRGSGSTLGVVRVRQAYVNFDWAKWALLVGQTWHPLFGEVSPSMLNLNTGAPFQPFNRSPLLRLRYSSPQGLRLTASALWQSQYNSVGPNGKSPEYIKNGNIPEVFVGIDYMHGSWTAGIGADMLSLRPRKQSEMDGKVYRVRERVTTLSFEAHAKYSAPNYKVSAKTVLANNLTHCSMVGGFAATAIDPRTGEMTYTPFRHSMSWLNFTYGHKWQPGIFVGYLKNLGTGKKITGDTWGTGLDVDQLVNVSMQLSYNLPHWTLGAEFTPCVAWYGSLNKDNGRVVNTHSVTNYRILATAIFSF